MKTTKRNQQRPNRKICERTETTPRREREIQRLVLLLLLSRETQNKHLHFSSTKISSLYTHTHLIKHRRVLKAKEKKERRNRERDLSRSALFTRSYGIVSVVLCALKRSRLLKVLKVFHFGQHDGQNVGKFLRATRGV